VGFVMGSGTDVCKEAADIIITDDNFVSVVDAVLFGRTFMKNIKKFLLFQLPINITLVIICLMYPVMSGVEALLAVHILIINIVVDSLNSLAFSAEPVHAEYMHDAAPRKGAPLLDKQMRANLAITTLVFVAFFVVAMSPWFNAAFDNLPDKNMAARFALLLFLAVVNGFCVRTDGVRLLRGIGKNPMFIVIACIIIAGAVLFTQFGGHMFGGADLNAAQWIILGAMAVCLVPIDMLRKKLLQKR
jgi:magnesium-transporting ATPase (P-type)